MTTTHPRPPLELSDIRRAVRDIRRIDQLTGDSWGWHLGVCTHSVDAEVWKLSVDPKNGLISHRDNGHCHITRDIEGPRLGRATSQVFDAVRRLEEKAGSLKLSLPEKDSFAKLKLRWAPTLIGPNYLGGLENALYRLETSLPGWWWYINNHRTHAEFSCGIEASSVVYSSWIHYNKTWDGGFTVTDVIDDRPVMMTSAVDYLVRKTQREIVKTLFERPVLLRPYVEK